MFTFEDYFKNKIQHKCIIHNISSPEKPVLRVEYFPTTMKYFVSGTVCIMTLSMFIKIAPANVTVFYILINDDNLEFDSSSINNYALLNKDFDGEKLFTETLNMLLSERIIDNAYNAITHALFNKSSIKTFLKITADLIGCPIFLSDSSTKVLESSDEDELHKLNDELITCVLKNGFVTADLFEKYDYTNLLKRIASSQKAFYLKSEIPEKLDRIISNIIINNRHFGWLVAIPSNAENRPEYLEILDILSNAISIELERSKTNISINSSENLLFDLLTDNFTSPEEFDKRARGFGWNSIKDYIVVAIGFRNQRDNNTKKGVRSMMAYKNHLSLIFPNIKSIYIKDRLALLIEYKTFNIILNNLEIFLKNNNLVASTSNVFSNIINFKEYYEQAVNILNLCLSLNKENTIFHYHEFYLYHCINTLKKSGHIEYYCLPELIKVIEYDKKNNTKIFETVNAYLNFRNIIQAAEYLNIHRNTLIYRLEKFKELTNINLSVGDDIYKLWLSYLILEVSPDIHNKKISLNTKNTHQ